MGIFSAWRVSTGTRTPENLASPWASSQLPQIAVSDILGNLEELPLTRTEAMRVPSVAKARNLLTSVIAPLPLRVLNKDGLVARQPTWVSRTDNTSPLMRLLWTIDDCLFFGNAVWRVTRGADGYPLTADRVPPELWTITDGHILIDGKEVDESEVLFFQGPHEGLLNIATATIRGGRDMETAWQARVRQPIPAMELREVTDQGLEDSEIQDILDTWKKARRSPDGAVGYVPYGYELHDHGATDAKLFEEGRNAVRTDIGAFTGIPSALMDASLSASTLTYSTQEGQRSEFLTFAVPMWTAPIEARLSMDDVVPSGQRVRLDLSDLIAPTAAATGVPTED